MEPEGTQTQAARPHAVPDPQTTPPGERPAGERPAGERPAGERPPGERPPGERPPGERVAEEAELLAAQAHRGDADGGTGPTGESAPHGAAGDDEGSAQPGAPRGNPGGPGAPAGGPGVAGEAFSGASGGAYSGASGGDVGPSLVDLIPVASSLVRGGLGAFSGALARWAAAVAAESASAPPRQAPPAYRPATRHAIEVRDLPREPGRDAP